MEMEQTALASEIAAALGLSPCDVLRRIAGARAGNRSKNHVGRDVQSLRRLGIVPQKICGKWVVPPGELARWAAGEAEPEQPASQAKRPRGPGRPRKSNGGDL